MRVATIFMIHSSEDKRRESKVRHFVYTSHRCPPNPRLRPSQLMDIVNAKTQIRRKLCFSSLSCLGTSILVCPKPTVLGSLVGSAQAGAKS